MLFYPGWSWLNEVLLVFKMPYLKAWPKPLAWIKILRLTFQGRLEMIYFLLLMQPADYAARECQDNIILWQDVMIAKVDAVLGELEETLDGMTGAPPMPNAAYLSFLFFPFRKHLDLVFFS